MSTFEERVAVALRIEDWSDSISEVKRIVHENIASADRTCTVTQTSFFNHSFEPDFWLDWPAERTPARPVYLRTEDENIYLARDVEKLGAAKPLLVTLSSPRGSSADEQSLVTSTSQAEVLLTTPTCVDLLALEEKDLPADLYASSLLKGGKGLLDGNSTNANFMRLSSGFRGARAGAIRETASALDLLDDTLSPIEAKRVTDVLQALWVGGGSASYDFPREDPDLAPQLTTTSLRVLLELGLEEEDEYWSRVARSVDLQLLESLKDWPNTPAFTALLRAAAPYLRAKVVSLRGVNDSSLPSDWNERWEESTPWDWSVRASSLRLSGHGYELTIADNLKKLDEAHESRERWDPIEPERIVNLQDVGPIVEVHAANGDLDMSLSVQSASSSLDGPTFAAIVNSTRSFGLVRRLALLDSSSHKLDINFLTQTGSTRGRGRIWVPEIAIKTFRTLTSIRGRLDDELQAALGGAFEGDDSAVRAIETDNGDEVEEDVLPYEAPANETGRDLQ